MNPGENLNPPINESLEDKMNAIVQNGIDAGIFRVNEYQRRLTEGDETARGVVMFSFKLPEEFSPEQATEIFLRIQEGVLSQIGITNEQVEQAKAEAIKMGEGNEVFINIPTKLDNRIVVEVYGNGHAIISINSPERPFGGVKWTPVT